MSRKARSSDKSKGRKSVDVKKKPVKKEKKKEKSEVEQGFDDMKTKMKVFGTMMKM